MNLTKHPIETRYVQGRVTECVPHESTSQMTSHYYTLHVKHKCRALGGMTVVRNASRKVVVYFDELVEMTGVVHLPQYDCGCTVLVPTKDLEPHWTMWVTCKRLGVTE